MAVKNNMENAPALASNARRPYLTPSLKRVPLRPEEAVLGNCKMASNGPLQGSCSSPAACSTLAS